MSDALLSAPVAIVGDALAIGLISVAAVIIRKRYKNVNVALMGVMGAFVFAAQMINFTIPGTGSSGHIVGGILLSTLLGAWPAFITLSSVLIIQALLFADGGILALGWNIINIAATSCLVIYPLIMHPFLKRFKKGYVNQTSPKKHKYPAFVIITILSCLIGLEIGAFGVTLETLASNITTLPFGKFLLFMLSIHFFIGIGEGLATAAILLFVVKYKPDILFQNERMERSGKGYGKMILTFAILAIVVGGVLSWYASSKPDGLEWSIEKVEVSENQEMEDANPLHFKIEEMQKITSIFPDYMLNNGSENEEMIHERAQTSIAGISGALIVLLITILLAVLINYRKRKQADR